MRLRIYLLLIIWHGLLLGTFAQDGRILRVELETRANARPYNIVPLAEYGILLFYKTTEKDTEGKILWLFQHYDTDLRASWKVQYALPERFVFTESVFKDSLARIVFTGSQTGANTNTAVILEVSPSGEYFLPLEFSIPERWGLSYFGFEGGKYILGINNKRFEAQVFLLERQEELIPLDLSFKGESWLDDAIYHQPSAQYLMLFRNRVSRKQSELVAMGFGKSGNRIWSEAINTERNKTAVSGRWMVLENITTITGAYSEETRPPTFESQNMSSITAAGLFSAQWQNGQQKSIQYYPFNEFTNFFSHLTYNEVSKLRSSRKGASSQFDRNILLSKVFEKDGEKILLAEAFFAKYHYITRMSYDYYGRPVPTSYPVFDGYQYTNAFIAGFDKEGYKAWDNNFPFKDILVPELRTRMDLLHDQEDIIMAYLADGRIASQVIRKNQVIGPFDYAEVEGSNPGKSVSEHLDESLVFWYDNYVICSGYQKLRSMDSALGDRKYVYYFTKVAYR